MAADSQLQQSLVNHPGGLEDSDEDIEIAPSAWRRPPSKDHASFKRLPSSYSPYLLAIAFICVSLVSAWGGMQLGLDRSLDARCAAYSTQWSPILRDVSIEYRPRSFNGSFKNEDIYRRPGSHEVDAAWEELGVNYRAGVISKEDGLKSGLDAQFVQRADKYGGGFLVNVEGMHHLHCVNLIRQALYFNYDRYKAMGHHAFKNEEPILRLHGNQAHCLDTIRQVMMCNVDTGVLGQVWVDPQSPMAFPNFNTKHVCKNFDDVRKWAENLQASPFDDTPPDFLAHPEPDEVMQDIP